MSLVGSLEDLGLGEILQIVSLSGKSGVLWIRSPHGEGRIVFDRGAIRGALVGDGPRDLRGLLLAAGAMPEADLETLHGEAQADGASFEEILVARTALDAARLDELRERHVETSVLRMFSWPMGEFSFEINDESSDPTGVDLLLRAGMNAQFLALEGTRLRDENVQGGEAPAGATSSDEEDADAMELAFDGEPSGDAEPVEAEPVMAEIAADGPAEMEITVLELLDEEIDDAETALLAEPDDDELAAPAVDEDPTLSGEEQRERRDEAQRAAMPAAAPVPLPPPPGAVPSARACSGVVIIDRDLGVLEWVKNSLAPLGLRTHIFPRSELAIQRIRQYFARGEMPLVVLTSDTPPDPVSGARDWSEIAARLRAQVPQLPLLVVSSADAAVSPANERAIPDAVATRPPLSVLADERAREKRDKFAEELRNAASRALARPPAPRPLPSGAREVNEGLRALREWSARLRDPASPSEVLRIVLEFAGRHFDRAAIFWLRDGEAQAMAQVGLPSTGGPDDTALRELCIAADAPESFRKVLASRAPLRLVPEEAGDLALTARLGSATPPDFYVGPVESGDDVVALLYADNAVTRRPLGDTSALEVILHEGGLALDRAVLERALEQVESGQRPAAAAQGDAEA
jgi:hypothetical protein